MRLHGKEGKNGKERVFCGHVWWPKQLLNFILFEVGVRSQEHLCKSVSMFISRGEMGRVFQDQGMSWDISCSALQKSRKALFFGMFSIYLRNSLFCPKIKGPKTQAQKSPDGINFTHDEHIIILKSPCLLHNIDTSHQTYGLSITCAEMCS